MTNYYRGTEQYLAKIENTDERRQKNRGLAKPRPSPSQLFNAFYLLCGSNAFLRVFPVPLRLRG